MQWEAICCAEPALEMKSTMFIRDAHLLADCIHSFGEISENLSTLRHSEVGGSRIRDLERVPYSLPYWESVYYYQKIDRWMHDMPRDSLVLDVGCEDGRFTMKLLDMGFDHVVAFDANVNSLLALHETLVGAGQEERVTLVHGNVLDLPFQRNTFDAVLCIGVLYYLNEEYEKAWESVARTLKSGGRMLETEPDQVGNAVKALLFDGLEPFLSVSHASRFVEYFDAKPLSLRCFSEEELHRWFSDSSMDVLGVEALSLFPSLLRIGSVKGIISDAEKVGNYVEDLRRAFDSYDGMNTLAKHRLWILQKK